MTYSGVHTALITPFEQEGTIDLAGFRLHIQRQKLAGASGLVVLGTTGEAATLTYDEKESLIKAAKEEAGALPVMAGCGSFSTAQTIEAIQRVADLGCDSALVISPFYNKPTQEGLYQHYEAISRASTIPIFLYNNPARTGINMSVDTIKRIADLPRICGIKESSGNVSQVGDIIAILKKQRPCFSVICGDDILTLPMMALGADGVISGGANLFPKKMVELVEACKKDDFKRARDIHHALVPLFNALCLESHPIPLKAALQLADLPSGHPRLPLTPLHPKYFSQLKDIWSNGTQIF
jgi:4-hydroxy-tetrahydrodipicolinate synthase